VAPHFPTDGLALESKAPKSPSIIVFSLNPWCPRQENVLSLLQQILAVHSFARQQQTVLLFHAPCPQDTSHLRVRTGIGHFRENTNICKFPVEMSGLKLLPNQTRKRRSTEAMRESEEIRKKVALGLQQHSTRSIAYQHTDDGMREPQYDSASTTSLAVGSSAPSSAQTSIEIDNFDIWDIEAGRGLVREKFSKIKTERRHKMEALEKQTLSDAMDYNLIRCCRCRSFTATDTDGLCADCFHTRCFECKHPDDLMAGRYGLADAEEEKVLK
jgi:hypothetical protein